MIFIKKSFSQLNETDKREIAQFIENNQGLIFHTTTFNEIVSTIYGTSLYCYFAKKGEEVCGIYLVHKIKKGLLSTYYSNNGNFEVPYGGWVLDNQKTNIEELWDLTNNSLFASSITHTSFLLKLPESITQSGKRMFTGIINLNQSYDEIWMNDIQSKRRNMIRKAEKSGVTIKKHGMEGFPVFYSLMQDTHERASLTKISSAFYEAILSNSFPDFGCLFIAYLDEKPLAGVALIGNKNVMHYWLGASAMEVPNLGQGDWLQWEAIKWAKDFGASKYDLCVIEPERLPHIAKFKTGFCSQLEPFYIISKASLSYRSVNFMLHLPERLNKLNRDGNSK